MNTAPRVERLADGFTVVTTWPVEFRNGYVINVWWSPDDYAWIAETMTDHGHRIMAHDNHSQVNALCQLVCAMAATIDVMEGGAK